ncbi:MAG TPA: helix-turn-helix domain-containing protein, partial [Puia sp.]|nr:helix-turn-helix domain-containing protein [Puia sp.]
MQQLIEVSLRKVLAEKSSTTIIEDKEIMSLLEATKFLNRSKQTIYQYTSRNEIPFYKMGKILNFSRKELVEWLESAKKLT